jgi:hypothetical protein
MGISAKTSAGDVHEGFLMFRILRPFSHGLSIGIVRTAAWGKCMWQMQGTMGVSEDIDVFCMGKVGKNEHEVFTDLHGIAALFLWGFDGIHENCCLG